jgi:hypothetical protein
LLIMNIKWQETLNWGILKGCSIVFLEVSSSGIYECRLSNSVNSYLFYWSIHFEFSSQLWFWGVIVLEEK